MGECYYRKPSGDKFLRLSNELQSIIEGDCSEDIKIGMCLSILSDVYFLGVDVGYDSCCNDQKYSKWIILFLEFCFGKIFKPHLFK